MIHVKDVQCLTGKSERSAQLLLQRVKAGLGKEKFQFVTIGEFCVFMKINREEVERVLR